MIKPSLGTCSGCDKPKLIVNKHFKMCKDCNDARLHPNKDEEVKQKAKKKTLVEQKIRLASSLDQFNFDRTERHKNKSIKKVSAKQNDIDVAYTKTCKIIDLSRDPICTGCGRPQGGDIRLSHSHLISRRQCKQIGRPDLIHNAKNITFHCLDFGMNTPGCHRNWENPKQRKELLDYDRNMEYVRMVSEDLYLQFKLNEDN